MIAIGLTAILIAWLLLDHRKAMKELTAIRESSNKADPTGIS